MEAYSRHGLAPAEPVLPEVAERMAQQFGLAYLGAVELDPEIRRGGDSGLPMALAGGEFLKAKQFYRVAAALAETAIAQQGKKDSVLEVL